MQAFADVQRADVAGARLAYRRGGSGETLLLIHGIPASSRLWDGVAPDLATDYDVVCVDMLGYGASDKPLDRDVSVTAQAGLAVGLLDALSVERATVVGHDIGGAVAQILATGHADRVARLGLVDSVSFDSWPIPIVYAIRAVAPLFTRLPRQVVAAFVWALGRDIDSPDARESLAAALEPWAADIRPLIRNWAALDSSHTQAVAPLLGGIAVPTSIVWGAADPFQPPVWATRLRDAIPGARLKLLDAGHFVPLERPADVAAEIRALMER